MWVTLNPPSAWPRSTRALTFTGTTTELPGGWHRSCRWHKDSGWDQRKLSHHSDVDQRRQVCIWSLILSRCSVPEPRPAPHSPVTKSCSAGNFPGLPGTQRPMSQIHIKWHRLQDVGEISPFLIFPQHTPSRHPHGGSYLLTEPLR